METYIHQKFPIEIVWEKSSETVLVSPSCYNKISQTVRLKQRTLMFSGFLRLEVWAKCRWISFLVRAASWPVGGHHIIVHSHGGERQLWSLSSYKDTNPILGTPSSQPHLNLITSQRHHLPMPSHWGWQLQQVSSRGDTNMYPMRERKEPHFSGALDASGCFLLRGLSGEEEAWDAWALLSVRSQVGPGCGLWEASRKGTGPRAARQWQKKRF